MPTQRCSESGKPGWKWGNAGKCYTYTSGNKRSESNAKQKAVAQGLASGDIGKGVLHVLKEYFQE